MTYKEFLEALEELELDLHSASEGLDIEIKEIKSWESKEEIPEFAQKWVKEEKVELAALNNTNEDDNIEEEELELETEDENLDLEKNE
tara:strand:+ start:512 stop:775 length:264 start_codon:yes stop_codon:yes gene_type:complete